MSTSASLHIEITAPIATVRLHGATRPDERRDAWSALAAAFERLSRREGIRCVVLTGAASISCVGEADGSVQGREEDATRAAAFCAIQRCELPTVAIVEGLCAGDALELVACCDLRVCGDSSRFGEPVAPDRSSASMGRTRPLERLLGPGPTLRMLLDGELIGAEQARRAGLVNRVHSDLTVVERGYGLAARIAAGAPLVNRWHKRVLQRLLDPRPVAERARREVRAAVASIRYDEGRTTFVERDEPRLAIN